MLYLDLRQRVYYKTIPINEHFSRLFNFTLLTHVENSHAAVIDFMVRTYRLEPLAETVEQLFQIKLSYLSNKANDILLKETDRFKDYFGDDTLITDQGSDLVLTTPTYGMEELVAVVMDSRFQELNQTKLSASEWQVWLHS